MLQFFCLFFFLSWIVYSFPAFLIPKPAQARGAGLQVGWDTFLHPWVLDWMGRSKKGTRLCWFSQRPTVRLPFLSFVMVSLCSPKWPHSSLSYEVSRYWLGWNMEAHHQFLRKDDELWGFHSTKTPLTLAWGKVERWLDALSLAGQCSQISSTLQCSTRVSINQRVDGT